MDPVAEEFLETYKRVDKFIAESYSLERNGMSEYIARMEACSDRMFQNPDWKDDYYALKHLRWVRNQLVHEVDALQRGVLKTEDLQTLRVFYGDLLSGADPLAQFLGTRRNRTYYTSAPPNAGAAPAGSGCGCVIPTACALSIALAVLICFFNFILSFPAA